MTTFSQMARAGRPSKTGPISDLDRERGKRVAAWIRSGMMPPHQTVEINNSELAKLLSMWPSAVGVFLNDCFDKTENRMKFPKPETIQKIAEKLDIDEQEGVAARYWFPPKRHTKTHYAVNGQIPDIPHESISARMKTYLYIAKQFERHGYEGRISDKDLDRVIEAMIISVELEGTEPTNVLAEPPQKDEAE